MKQQESAPFDLSDEETPFKLSEEGRVVKNYNEKEIERQIGMARQACQQGRRILREGKYMEASKEFSKAVIAFKIFLQNYPQLKGRIAALLTQTVIPSYSNLSLCYLKLENWGMVLQCTNGVLAQNTAHPKSLYRRAIAHKMLKNFQESRHDFQLLRKIDPSMEHDIIRELKQLQQLQKQELIYKRKVAAKLIQGYQSPEKLDSKLQPSQSNSHSLLRKVLQKVKDWCKRTIVVNKRHKQL